MSSTITLLTSRSPTGDCVLFRQYCALSRKSSWCTVYQLRHFDWQSIRYALDLSVIGEDGSITNFLCISFNYQTGNRMDMNF